ncbi:hypothetical protein FACS1894211_03680 [Clostridia bacterium]|nr:hypothetical protein FACS1894211_03680 [Clostridia bacterium]
MKRNYLKKCLAVLAAVLFVFNLAPGASKRAGAIPGEGDEVVFPDSKPIDNAAFNSATLNGELWQAGAGTYGDDLEFDASAPEVPPQPLTAKEGGASAILYSRQKITGASVAEVEFSLAGYSGNTLGLGYSATDASSNPYASSIILFSSNQYQIPWSASPVGLTAYTGYNEDYWGVAAYFRVTARFVIASNGDTDVYFSSTEPAATYAGNEPQENLQNIKVLSAPGLYASEVTGGGYFTLWIHGVTVADTQIKIHSVKITQGETLKLDETFNRLISDNWKLSETTEALIAAGKLTAPAIDAVPVPHEYLTYDGVAADYNDDPVISPDVTLRLGDSVTFTLNPSNAGGANWVGFSFTVPESAPTFDYAKSVIWEYTNFVLDGAAVISDYGGYTIFGGLKLHGPSEVRIVAAASGDMEIWTLSRNNGGQDTGFAKDTWYKAYTGKGYFNAFFSDGNDGFRITFLSKRPACTLYSCKVENAMREVVYESSLVNDNLGGHGFKAWTASPGFTSHAGVSAPTNFGLTWNRADEDYLYSKNEVPDRNFSVRFSLKPADFDDGSFGMAFGLSGVTGKISDADVLYFYLTDGAAGLKSGGSSVAEEEIAAITGNVVVTLRRGSEGVGLYIDGEEAAFFSGAAPSGKFAFVGEGGFTGTLYAVDMVVSGLTHYAPAVNAPVLPSILYVGTLYDLTPDINDIYGETNVTVLIKDAGGTSVGAALNYVFTKAGTYTAEYTVTNQMDRYTSASLALTVIMPDAQNSVAETFSQDSYSTSLFGSSGLTVSGGKLSFGGAPEYAYFGTAAAASNYILTFELSGYAADSGYIALTFGRPAANDAIADSYSIKFLADGKIEVSNGSAAVTEDIGFDLYAKLASQAVLIRLDVRGGAVKLSMRGVNEAAELLNVSLYSGSGFVQSGLVGITCGEGAVFSVDNFNFVNTNAAFPGNTDPKDEEETDPPPPFDNNDKPGCGSCKDAGAAAIALLGLAGALILKRRNGK